LRKLSPPSRKLSMSKTIHFNSLINSLSCQHISTHTSQ
jgi:hypothetical protein